MYIFVAFLFFLAGQTFCQEFEFGGSIGTILYKGEVSSNYNYKTPGISANFFVKQNISHVCGIKYMASMGKIYASDKNSKQPLEKLRNHDFTNNIGEIAGLFFYNFKNYRESPKTFKVSSKWSPYFIGGIGIFAFNRLVEGRNVGNFNIPFGLGIKWITSKRWNIGVEFLARKTFTDYLDGLGKNDPNLIQRSFTNDNDWYSTLTIGISHTIYNVKCPESNPTYQRNQR